jgi:hypothetical protein
MTMNLGITHNSNPNSTTVMKHEMYFHIEGDGRCDTQIIQMGLKGLQSNKGKNSNQGSRMQLF